jgi:hypothetical protein
MAQVTAQQKKQEAKEPDEIVEPSDIVIAGYKSLDKQIEELDKIPSRVQGECESLLDIVFDALCGKKNILEKPEDISEFIRTVQLCNSEVGLAWHMLIAMDQDQNVKSEKREVQLPPLPNIPNAGTGSPPSTVVMGPPAPVKQAFFAPFWEHMSIRRLASAYERSVEGANRQPEITTSKVKNVRDYGQELEAEWTLLLDFYTRAQCLVRYRNDEVTKRLLLREIQAHCVKVTKITKSFCTTIVEYRKDKFGDRKVGMTAGAMWVVGMLAQQPQIQGIQADSLRKLWNQPSEK